jgi:hypothetical protein
MRMTARGQQTTFTYAAPVFKLNVWNREANQAAAGKNRPFDLLSWRPESGHSTSLKSLHRLH